MIKNSVEAVVLAAGSSLRFKTRQTKQLSNICGQPMVLFSLKVLNELQIPSALVLGPQSEDIRREVQAAHLYNVAYFLQPPRIGTAHAVACTKEWWTKDYILVFSADVPLLTANIIETMIERHKETNATVSFLSSYVLEPRGFGRVIEQDGRICIVEEKECTESQRAINRVNAGIYLVNRSFLELHIDDIVMCKTNEEISITEIIKRANTAGKHVEAVTVPYDNVRGVNTLEELWAVQQIKRSDIIKYWMARGVRFELAQNIHIDINVTIGEGTFIGTGVHLLGNTHIGKNCKVNAFSIVEDTMLGNDSVVHSHSVVQHSVIGERVHVGPFARLHHGVTLKDDSVIGNFVEVKNSAIGAGSKVKHLAYIGDASVGDRVNIGAGTITCNYDGHQKHRTVIKDDVFVGSNNTLVAPVTLNEGAFTAAGSTITQDVAADALAIARSRQVSKDGYAAKLRARARAQEASEEKKVVFSPARKPNASSSHEV